MCLVAVYHGACRELVVSFLAVQRFLDAPVVLLAFFIAFAIFEGDACLVFFPIVAVVSVEMPFVEAELWYQYRPSRQLVVVVQHSRGIGAHHDEEVQIVRVVA